VSALPAPVEQLVGGLRHSCARLTTQQLYCWGGNVEGELGDGTLTARPTPTLVADEVRAASASDSTLCVVYTDGRVACAGDNGFGEVGDGTRRAVAALTDVPGITDAVDVAAGRDHTCALHADGAVSCWGSDLQGELGLGAEDFRPTSVHGFD